MSDFSFTKLTKPQKWQWHAQVYALRRVALDVPHDVRTSPCDPRGEWFDEHQVAQAEAELRAKHAEQSHRCASDTAARNAVRVAEAAAGRATRAPTPPPPQATE